jgi:hypothetical protein
MPVEGPVYSHNDQGSPEQSTLAVHASHCPAKPNPEPIVRVLPPPLSRVPVLYCTTFLNGALEWAAQGALLGASTCVADGRQDAALPLSVGPWRAWALGARCSGGWYGCGCAPAAPA